MSAPLLKERADVLAAAHAIVAAAKDTGRELTADDIADLEVKTARIGEIDAALAQAKRTKAAIDQLGQLGTGEDIDGGGGGDAAPKDVGRWYVKHAAARFAQLREAAGAKGGMVVAAGAPWFEVKAAADPQITTGAGYTPILTEYDRTIVQGPRLALVVEDLLSHGTLSGNAISYFVEAALEGAFTTVAEGGAKPQLHVIDPTSRTDTLKKIAGFLKFSDEMLEDLDFIVSEINNRGLYQLGQTVQTQLVAGDGIGTNILGLYNRSGIQTEVSASKLDNPDALFRAVMKVQTGSGLIADGIGMHPLDYQALRLAKDANAQYMGGGFFMGAYGNGAIQENPPIWGLRTVVSPAFTLGFPLVGAYQQAATAYDKAGRGVRVESTNSDGTDFTSNMIKTRIEVRKALAVRVPVAFVKVTLSALLTGGNPPTKLMDGLKGTHMASTKLEEYTVNVNGVDHTLLLDTDDAERYGAAAKKAGAPENKAAAPQNKAAEPARR